MIAIIAILAAMLLPALNKARGMALQTTCLNHLSNIGKAFLFYAQDNGDFMPAYRDGGTPEKWWNDSGNTGLLWRYLNNTATIGRSIDSSGHTGKIYCPATGDRASIRSTYGYNLKVYTNREKYRLSSFKRPSACVLSGDSGIAGAILAPSFTALLSNGAFGTPHANKGAFVFCDGRAAALNFQEIPNNEQNYRCYAMAFWQPAPVPGYENWYYRKL